MEHAVAAEHALAMEHLELPESVMGRKFRVPQSVLNPTTRERSSRQNEVRKDLNAYVADEEEELAREAGRDVCVVEESVGPSEEAAQVPIAANLERIEIPFVTARTSPVNKKPERIPTPFPFFKGQYTKSEGKKPIASSTDAKPKFNTSPARLERISSSSPLQLDLFPSPPRASSVQGGKGEGDSISLPSKDELQRWRLESTSSAASSLHPGIRTPVAPRYSPLHKAPKDRDLPTIDSVISPLSTHVWGTEDAPALRYADFFSSPVNTRSPINKEGAGIASPMSSERFYRLPEYTGSSTSSSRTIRPRRRSASQAMSSSPGSTVSEGRVVASPVPEAEVGLGFEMDEVVCFQDWIEEVEREDRARSSFSGKVKGLLKKMRGRGSDEEHSGVERRTGVLWRLRRRVARMGGVRGRIFGRTREV